MMNHKDTFKEWNKFANSYIKPTGIAVDLNFKKFIYLQDGRMKRKVYLTREIAEKNVRHFLNILNKNVYGNASHRFNKKINVFSVFEGGNNNKQLHIHMTMDVPEHIERDKFVSLVSELWIKTDFGNRNMCIQDIYEINGRHQYMLKKRTKVEDIQSSTFM